MRRIEILMACGALALAFGCGDNRGGSDGGITIPDGGGGGSDAGGGGGGTCGSGTCTLSASCGLADVCLPRCAASTVTAINSCPADASAMDQQSCIDDALSSDTTAPAQLMGSTGGSQPISCQDCYYAQQESCYAKLCPTQFQSFIQCVSAHPDGGTAACSTQNMALNSCLQGMRTMLSTCLQTRVPKCFPTSGGFLPQPQLQLNFRNLPLSFSASYAGLL